MIAPTLNSRPALLMFVDDRKEDIILIENAFQREKVLFNAEYFSTGQEAQERLRDDTKPLPDLLFIDRNLNFSSVTGEQLIEEVCLNRSRYAQCHVVCISGAELDAQTKDRLTKIGMETFLPKPLKMEHIKVLINMHKDYYYQIMRQFTQAITQ